MTQVEIFSIEQVLSQIEVILVRHSNSSEFEFLKKLKEELTEKLNKE